MRPFCNANVSWHGRNVEAHASYIIPHMVHLTTKPYFSQNGETVHIDTCYNPSRYLSFEQLLQWDLAHMHCDVSRGVGAQVMRVVDYAHFAQNKSESLSIILWYNALPFIIFDHAFHTSSTKPNLCTKFSHNHNVHSRLQKFIGSSWTLRLATQFHTYHVKCNIFGLIGPIWPLKTIIELIYLSTYLSPKFGHWNLALVDSHLALYSGNPWTCLISTHCIVSSSRWVHSILTHIVWKLCQSKRIDDNLYCCVSGTLIRI